MEFIDDHPVVSHSVRFTDRTEIAEADAPHVRDGAEMVWIVQAACQPPSYHPVTKGSEERYRYNLQRVERAVVLTGALRESAIAYLDDPEQRQGYLAFEAPRYSGEDTEKTEPDWHGADDDEEHPAAVDLPLFDLDDPSVEVVGTIYRPGHESPTQKLLREAWGQS